MSYPLRWGSEVEQVRIVTPDKDLGQVLAGERVVQVDRVRRKVIDEAALLASRGVAPASVPDLLALVGDTADGIPGLPGFGNKTAAALLRRYGHIEAIPDSAESWDVEVRGKDRLAATLREARDEALLYRRLATLVTEVPLRERLDDLCWQGVPRQAFLAFEERLGTNELRVPRWK